MISVPQVWSVILYETVAVVPNPNSMSCTIRRSEDELEISD